jgi:branched-chain amino acid transport system ATP-binding protein
VSSRSAFGDALRQPASYESELAVSEVVDDIVERLGLGGYADTLTGELSTGSRRIVDIACMLASDPEVLLLDEPSSGVAQKETEALADLLRSVREQTGCAMIVIEHDMPMLCSIADRLIALELGGIIAEGAPADVLAHPLVIESYLGTGTSAINRSGPRAVAAPA